MNELLQASEQIKAFRADSLRKTVANPETEFLGAEITNANTLLAKAGIAQDLLLAAILIKKHSSQIDEIIHALGILIALPGLLKKGEIVKSLSLAAGNTGKSFDLETNMRVAEFTFIDWKGGPEVIRQNKIFKDFFFLAEFPTDQRKELYTIGIEYPKKFFNSKRSLQNILKGNAKLGEAFRKQYGNRFSCVRDYFKTRESEVSLQDVADYIPCLKKIVV